MKGAESSSGFLKQRSGAKSYNFSTLLTIQMTISCGIIHVATENWEDFKAIS